MSRYIDADAYCAEMRDFQNRISKWMSEAETDEAKHRSESAYVTLVEAKLILDKQPTVDAVPVVWCKDCKRNADNGGLYPNGRTQCPIQEHYALLQDGYCHLAECKEVQRNFNASNTLDALETEVTE